MVTVIALFVHNQKSYDHSCWQ